MMHRLALARPAGDPLSEIVAAAGWSPLPCFSTAQVPTGAPCPLPEPDAVILLSPGGARFAELLEGVPVLATGEGTARHLEDHPVHLAPEPTAEGLWALLQDRYPQGGDFLLVRAERSRGWLQERAEGSPWRLHAWITHAERPAEGFALPACEAVLALSPLQAEVLGPEAPDRLRLGWGERAAAAFARVGYPAHAWCEPRPDALLRLLIALKEEP